MSLEPGIPASAPRGIDESWPLVGRDSVIERAVSAISGPSRTVLAYGPSGIGKSRVVQAVTERLVADGWCVLAASGNTALSAVPLGALAPVLAGDPSMVAASGDPVALYAAASAAVRDLADGRRVVLAVDDVSAVDPVSVGLISQLVETGTLRLVATVREADPLPDALIPLASSGDSTRLDIDALDVDRVAELLTRVLGGPVAHRAAVELHGASHGNPLFLRELAIGAANAGSLRCVDGLWQLVGEPVGTPALRDLIRARLRRLGDDERDAVERLALCEPLAFDEFTRPGAHEALAELETHGLIRVDESADRMRVRLAHPHYASAVRDSIPRLRALSLLVEQAEVVASRPMSAGDELRVAIWRLDAGRPSDPGVLARTAALARMAHDRRTAERLAAAAVAAGADDAASLLLHGELLWSLGRADEAIAALERAEQRARSDGGPEELLAAIGAARADVLGGDPLGSARGIALLESLERALPSQAATLALRKAVLLVNLGYARDALAQVEAAASALGEHGVPQAMLDLARAMPLATLGRNDEAVAAAERAVAFAENDGTAFPLRRAEIVLAHALISADRLGEARATLIESLHEAIRDDDELTARLDEFMMGQVFWQLGRLDAAARWFRDTVGGAELHGPKSLREIALCFLAIIAAEQGDLVRARDLRARVVDGLDEEHAVAVVADAWIAVLEGRPDAAAAMLLERVDVAEHRGAVGIAAPLLHHLMRFGSRAHARTAAERLARLAETSDSPALQRRLAHARAEADADAVALRAIGAEWESIGCALYAAEAFASAGQAARAAGHGREATADLQRSASLAAACEGARTPLLQFSDGAEPLTPREREIASLAAQGLSSNEIATRLFLSPRTVNNHLQSTYAKLGIRGRHELRV
ncbi:LuxR family transcriptional regulator [Agromyces sp. H66]|uniref:helix-turn-helix transcriptional regulator n=1 Tax=Agromyces sp. H66 TaxID=2529859 RepID=UPI00145B3278|nr:LuxR family transcriptional regulator [Agromyces sp. H66]